MNESIDTVGKLGRNVHEWSTPNVETTPKIPGEAVSGWRPSAHVWFASFTSVHYSWNEPGRHILTGLSLHGVEKPVPFDKSIYPAL